MIALCHNGFDSTHPSGLSKYVREHGVVADIRDNALPAMVELERRCKSHSLPAPEFHWRYPDGAQAQPDMLIAVKTRAYTITFLEMIAIRKLLGNRTITTYSGGPVEKSFAAYANSGEAVARDAIVSASRLLVPLYTKIRFRDMVGITPIGGWCEYAVIQLLKMEPLGAEPELSGDFWYRRKAIPVLIESTGMEARISWVQNNIQRLPAFYMAITEKATPLKLGKWRDYHNRLGAVLVGGLEELSDDLLGGLKK